MQNPLLSLAALAVLFVVVTAIVACSGRHALSRSLDKYGWRPSMVSGILQMVAGGVVIASGLMLPSPNAAAFSAILAFVGATAIASGVEKIRRPPSEEIRPLWYRGQGRPEWQVARSWRRERRITLSWIGVVMLVLCIAFAVFSASFRSATFTQQRHENAVARVSHLGGAVQQTDVTLAGAEITDDDLLVLRDLQELQSLNVGNTAISDEGMAFIADLNQLRRLTLSGTKVTDRGLTWLSSLPRLRELDLRQTAVTGTGFASVRAPITVLDLSRCPVTNAGLDAIAKLESLETLSLEDTEVDDSMMASLRGLEVSTLDVRRTELSAQRVEELQMLRPELLIVAP